jgi:hypothetical protein
MPEAAGREPCGRAEAPTLPINLLAGLLLVCMVSPLAAESIVLTTLPMNGNVTGIAGSTVGWGYSITNNSDTDWFVPTALNPDSSFSNGTPTLLFDFPDLAPDTAASEIFDPVNDIGLYEFVWEASAPEGFINSGNFVLSGEWWDGDPLNGGNFIADAIDTSTAYSASVGSIATGSTPEPSSIVMMLAGWGAVCVSRRLYKCR